MGERFDSWVHAGPFTRTGLARYRVIYAIIVLLLLPDFTWISVYPDAMFDPPPGMMRLFDGFPPESLLWGLEALVGICLVAILIGWRTRTASFLLPLVAMVGFGFTYSLGKIDHDILLILVPPAMALAGWGDRLSVDALRRRSNGEPEPSERAHQWPLRLFAVLIGLAFVTAALPKIRGDWLNPATHVVRGTQLRQYYGDGETDYLANFFLGVKSPLFWELLDVATIVLEAGVIVAVLSWATTRLWFAIAAFFHLGVFLMINIPFWHNVLAYAFVVDWDRLPLPAALRRPRPVPLPVLRAAPLAVVAGGVAWTAVIDTFGDARDVVYPAVLGTGGLVAGGYLVVRLLGLFRDGGDESRGRLIYDMDCGFCTRSARWLAGRRPERVELVAWQAVPDLAALGLTQDDVQRRAYWEDSTGTLHGGSQAIAMAMVARGGPITAALGRLIASPVLSPVAARVYRWVAEHRHQMPGSTDSCHLPRTPEPDMERRPSGT